MKPEIQPDSDPLLRQALHEWVVKDPLPPRFRERVWQRIAREEGPATGSLWSQFVNWVEQALARPSLAVSYVTVLLVAGLLAGHWQAQRDSARMTQELGARYVQLLDPYQMPARAASGE